MSRLHFLEFSLRRDGDSSRGVFENSSLVLVRFVGKFLVDEQFAAEATEAGTGGKKSQ